MNTPRNRVALAALGLLLVVLFASHTFQAAPDTPVRSEPVDPVPPASAHAVKAPRPPAVLTVVTCYEGMPAEQIESLITNHVERWLAQLPGVALSESRSLAGVSLIRLTLQPGTDLALTVGRANSLLLAVSQTLPPGCQPPLLRASELGDTPLVGIVVIRSAVADETQLGELARRTVRPALGRLPGLFDSLVLGGKERQIGIFVDQAKLQARNLTAADIYQAIDNANAATLASGALIETGRLIFGTGTGGIDELGGLVVRSGVGGTVYLRDVARPTATASQSMLTRIDGKRVVCLALFSTTPAATVQKAVAKIGAELPEGTTLTFLPCGGANAAAAEITIALHARFNTKLEELEKRVAAVERFLEGVIPAEEREWVMSELGRRADSSAISTQNAGPHDATIRIRLGGKRTRTAREYVAILRERFAKEKEFADLAVHFRARPVGFNAFSDDADLAVRLRGGRVAARAEAADRVRERIGALPGVVDVRVRQRRDAGNFVIDVDRAKAAALGLSSADIYRQITAMTHRSGPAGSAWVEPRTGERYSVVLHTFESELTLETLLDMPLKGAAQNKPIPLRNVARVEKVVGAVEIDHVNGVPVFDVLIDTDGKDSEAVRAAVAKLLQEQKWPASVTPELRQLSPTTGR